MKAKFLLIIQVLSSTLITNTFANQIDCSKDDVYCTSEFKSTVGGNDTIASAIAKLPSHVKRNLTFKRGNNLLFHIKFYRDDNASEFARNLPLHIAEKVRFEIVNENTIWVVFLDESIKDDFIAALPDKTSRRLRARLGRGMGYVGPHGHKVSQRKSGSSSPTHPRAFVWDETTGFSATWNSGEVPEHRASSRIDLYDFDFENKKHRLFAWFPKGHPNSGYVGADFLDRSGNTCMTCHGEAQRPIFPMYPDWPQFYGAFNDELSGYPAGKRALRFDLKRLGNLVQPIEYANYFSHFLIDQAKTNPRYSTLFDAQLNDFDLAYPNNVFYPYRPATITSPFKDTSRAFAHRPNLRLGVLYNRLVALQAFEKIKASPIFQKFPETIFYSLLDCSFDFEFAKSQDVRPLIFDPLMDELKNHDHLKSLELKGPMFEAKELSSYEKRKFFEENYNGVLKYYGHHNYWEKHYKQIPYEDWLKLVGLELRDIDIRFAHNARFRTAKGYRVFEPKSLYFTDNVMDIGYIERKYVTNPICNNSGKACRFTYRGTYMQGMDYFNSYWDGSATTNELLAAQMMLYLTDKDSVLPSSELTSFRDYLVRKIKDPSIYFETLTNKYDHFSKRFDLDKTFFKRMDNMSPWIQLPYPPDLINIQNRESFWSQGAKKIRYRHALWKNLSDRNNGKFNHNEGKNMCVIVKDALFERYINP